ncbi:helix-turn-helix domain-containing protein, partial [Acinetobacter baumannii]|nr:helix-turn-helix domain-containing protein [Acinetobacter baumannii]
RELENAIEYALNFESSQIINAASLPKKIQEESLNTSKVAYDYNLRDIEINSIKKLIEIHGDNYEGKVKIAEKLGISMSTLYRRLKTYRE